LGNAKETGNIVARNRSPTGVSTSTSGRTREWFHISAPQPLRNEEACPIRTASDVLEEMTPIPLDFQGNKHWT